MVRERLPEVVETTLTKFLRDRFGGNWNVTWHAGRGKSLRGQQWLCNLYVNAIFRPGADPTVFEIVRREFAVSPIWWRRPFQLAYFCASVSRPLAQWLAQATLEITPDIPGSEAWLIVAGSSKLRIIDTKLGFAYCCRKSNATPTHFRRELEARKLAASVGVPVPHVLEELDADCIVEQMIVGTPLNRLPSAHLRSALPLALSALRPLHDHAPEIMAVSEYATGLANQASAAAKRSKYACAHAEEVTMCLETLRAELARFTDRHLTTALAHGDFQPANILWSGRGCWLIDFEHSGRRQIDYDVFTYQLAARSPLGMADRIAARVRADSALVLRLQVFLLEELLFRLQETENLRADAPWPQWSQFVHECLRAFEILRTYTSVHTSRT